MGEAPTVLDFTEIIGEGSTPPPPPPPPTTGVHRIRITGPQNTSDAFAYFGTGAGQADVLSSGDLTLGPANLGDYRSVDVNVPKTYQNPNWPSFGQPVAAGTILHVTLYWKRADGSWCNWTDAKRGTVVARAQSA